MYLLSHIAVGILAAVLAQGPTKVPGESADAAELSRLETVWNDAHVRGDADALDALWAEHLSVTVPNMKVIAKSGALEIARSGRMKFLRYETSEIRIRVYDNAAIVTGRVHRVRQFNGRDVEDTWQFTKMYVHVAGAWKVVAWHASDPPQ